MRKIMLLIIVLTVSGFIASAQRGPLRGSGKLVERKLQLDDFNRIELLDLDGTLEITVGNPFDVAVSIDDNLADLLDATVNGGTLAVKLKGNLNNRLYIEETNIHLKISLPQLQSVFHRSNGKLTINGLAGKFFSIKNTGNGSAFLNGAIDELHVVCRDNGSVYADKLSVKTITARRSGNGNIYVNRSTAIEAQSSGNGKVIVVGKEE